MLINKNKVFVLLFCLCGVFGFSQKQDKKLAKANAKYDEFSYVEAGKLYERLVKSGNDSPDVYARLGDTYFFNSDYVNALEWYSKLIAKEEHSSPEHYYRYSVSLRANDKHEEALTVMNGFYEKTGKEYDAKKWDAAVYLKAIKEQSGRYAGVTEAGINSPLSDFGVAFVPNIEAINQAIEISKFEKSEKERHLRESAEKRKKADNNKLIAVKGEISTKEIEINKESINVKSFEKLPKYKEVIYASAKDSGGFAKLKHNWNERPFLKLYSAQITEDGMLENEEKLSGDINTKFHQSSPVLTSDGLTMYFTRLVPFDKKKTKSENKNGIGQLKIFEAQKIKEKWGNIKELPYPVNADGSSSAHPALSPDGEFLYFVSNRKKKMNDTDLYVVSRKKSGGFASRAEPLDEINTFGRETFPFIDATGILYFSSDGQPGLGGLDVFAAVKDNEGKYEIVNVGEPINSPSDDFAYTIESDTKRGFFSSNRKSGTGDDDVYKFLEVKPIVFPFKLSPVYFGTVKDSVTGEPLRDVEVIVYNDQKEKIKTMFTDESGQYTIDLPPLKNHTFVFKKNGFTREKVFVEGQKIGEKKEISVGLFNELNVIVDDKVVTLKEGDDLTEKLKLNPIYFDYGGYTLRKSSKLELDKVLHLIKDRPSISIEVKSHTDSRGKDDYNMKLSKNRAKTTMDYIIHEGGISKDRISGDGYGETQLINKCANGIKCTEAEHELNRRSEFIIIIKEEGTL